MTRSAEPRTGHKKCPPRIRVRAWVSEGGGYFLVLFAAFFCFGLFFAGFLVALRAFWVFAMGKSGAIRTGLGAADEVGGPVPNLKEAAGALPKIVTHRG